MSLVYAGVCSHAPGITARRDMAPKELRDGLYGAYERMRRELEASRPDVLVMITPEHFGTFFDNNMPTYAVGLADHYDGPVEDPAWLGIPRRRVRGDAALSRQLIAEILQTVDVATCAEWKFDHGFMVPIHFLDPDNTMPLIPVHINCQVPPLSPLHRAWALGEALRRAADSVPARVAVVGTGGISHWPANPDSGTINEAWDRDFLDRWARNDRQALLAYSPDEVFRDAGPGGCEIRAFIAVAAAARGVGTVHFYAPIPIWAVGCTTASMSVE